MNWLAFCHHGEAPTKAFEAFINHLFERWCTREYGTKIKYFMTVNGAGGDGGVEAYAKLDNKTYVGVQSKWFLNSLGSSEIGQIRGSVRTAKKVRPDLKRYIVSIPRDLASLKAGIKKPEEKRWTDFIDEMKIEFPDLEIELWNESRIRDELQLDDSGGIRRYWFEKEEISHETMLLQFQKVKNGWLNQKYIPSLHGIGRIHKETNILLGEKIQRQQMIKKLNSDIAFIEECIKELNFGINLYNQENDLVIELKRVCNYLSDIFINLNILCESCQFDIFPTSLISNANYPDLYLCLNLIEALPIQSTISVNRGDLKKVILSLLDQNIESRMDEINNHLTRNHLFFLGDPGTGKTHGLANAIENYLENSQKPAIIIQASQFVDSDKWRKILVDTLGLSDNWSEEEVWGALEAFAYRCDVRETVDNQEDNSNLNVDRTKVLICIDGLDESIPWEHWLEKINEMKVVMKKFKRIRVVIASRPYVIPYQESFPVIYLPSEGDIKVNELFTSYIEYFNITFENNEEFSWLKWSLRTPLALRLFCEYYQNKRLSTGESVLTTISHLLSKKIQHVDIEINKRFGQLWSKKEYVILRSLVNLSKEFLNNQMIERSKLCDLIISSQEQDIINQKTALQIVDYLVEYGLLYEYRKKPENPLIPPQILYEIANQPLMDYLLAVNMVEDITKYNKKEIPAAVKYRNGAKQMAAIILLQESDIFIGRDGLWTTPSPTEGLFDLQLFALANVSPEKTIPFVERTEQLIVKSMPLCRKITNELVAKVARIDNHPLGPMLIHNILMKINTVSERDLFWSLPEYVPERSSEKSWEGTGSSINSVGEYDLLESDRYQGLPLLYAWQLTIVDNKIRSNCRKKLTKWGIENPDEFIGLLKITYSTNDPQMKEDLLSCAYGVASRLTSENTELKLMAEWVLDEIFNPEKISEQWSAVIRFAGRAVVERAYMFDFINVEQVKYSRPPYNTGSKLAQLDYTATLSTKEGYGQGYSPITMDFSQYVIKQGYEDFFKAGYSNYHKNGDGSGDYVDFPTDLLKRFLELNQKSKNSRLIEEVVLERDEEEKRSQELHQSLVEWLDFQENEESSVANVEDIDDQELETKKKTLRREQELSKNDVENLNKDFSSQIQKFLHLHGNSIHLDTITPHQFAVGFGIAYLKQMGWNQADFYGKPNGGLPGEDLGVDIAIMRQYNPATHGSKSPIMQFCEKYLWCAIHEMLGYLADRLPFYHDSKENEWVSDYSILIDVPNPIQEIKEESIDSIRKKTGWFLPNELNPSLDNYQNDSIENITKWIDDAPVPEFSEWIFSTSLKMLNVSEDLKGDWTCLSNYTSLTEPKTLTESNLWINSFFVKSDDFPLFKEDCLQQNQHLIKHLINSSTSMYSTPKTDTYMNPSALSWMHWIKDDDETFSVYTLAGNDLKKYPVYKSLSEVTYSSVEEREFTFSLPSERLRNTLKIADGDGWRYWDKENEMAVFYSIAGTSFRDSQNLLYAKTTNLNETLAHHAYNMFWVIRLLREPSIKVRDKYKSYYYDKDQTIIMYEHEGKMQFIYLK